MRHKYFICLALIVLISSRLPAQVNLQTGSGNFSLPLFNWKDDKSRLTGVVALSYSSGNGLKVSDVASNAGQGWNLIAGGVIVRNQAGEPDDQYGRDGAEDDITKYPPGKLYATVPVTNGFSTSLTKYPIYGWKNQVYTTPNIVAEDKQLDFFSFQFNGKAGTFVLNPSTPGIAKTVGDSKLKITYQLDASLVSQGIRTRISSFTLQDNDGLIYKFSAKSLTRVLQTNFCDQSFTNIIKQPKFRNDKVFYQTGFDVGPTAAPWVNSQMANPFVVSSWYLTEIEDALTHRKIYLNYITRTINSISGEDLMANKNNKEYGIVYRKVSIEQAPALSSIYYPDGHSAVINFGAARADLNGDFTISAIDILYQGRYLSRHELNTTYFILNRYGTPTTDYQKKMSRLCLKSVRKIGIDLKEDTPPYIFDYYTGSGVNKDFVPPPFTFAKDLWGYYNGNNSKGFWDEEIRPDVASFNEINHYNSLKGLCYLRVSSPTIPVLNAKNGYAKNGLLKQIIYPTGGTLSYEYEQNTGIINGSTVDAGGVHISKTSTTDGGYSNDCANPISTQYSYVTAGGSQSSLWGLEMPVNKTTNSNHYQPEYRVFKLRLFQFPTCVWKFQYPGILSQTQASSLSAQRWMAVISTAMDILSIIGTVHDILQYAAGATGPVAIIIDIIVTIVEFVLACFGDNARDKDGTIYYNANLNAAAPLPTQFKRVEVIDGTGGIGKTVQEFTSEDDYPLWIPANNNPVFSVKQRFAPWAYGLPKVTTVYDVNGQKIKQTINEYSLSDTCYGGTLDGGGGLMEEVSLPPACTPKAKVPLNIKSAKALLLKSSSQRNTIWSDPNVYSTSYQASSDANMKVDIYDMYTGRTELKSTSERVFKAGDPNQYLETKTNYFYNSLYNYDVNKVVTTQSNGDINTKFIYYNSDYNTGVLATLVQQNILSLPISTLNMVTKYGTYATYYLSTTATEYTQLANGDIKIYRNLQRRSATPATPYANYGGPGSDISAYKIAQTFTYDAAGNLTGVKDEGNRHITNLYDYDDKYAVASVINADPSTDKTAYTSFETTSFGKWVLSGSASYSSSNAVTGNRSFVLSGGNILQASSLNTARPYTVSFWSTTGSVSVSGGATLTKSAPFINNFTYYEYAIAQGTSTVTVGGTGTIDELRVYPSTARMRTLSYDPAIGKTSEADENNRITYYTYDNLGRLQFIKDENRNIVKMYEYNTISAGKQNGCPGIYYNKLITEKFTRSCGPGYTGSEVDFIVPANVYSSTISQADADAKAEYYILTSGQAYANATGNCLYIYYNASVSQTYTSESCPVGYFGGNVTYTVPAGRYSSTLSQADADEQATDDIAANGEHYANSPDHRVCIFTSGPQWEWPENGPTYCQNVNGVPHLFIQETDINPYSSSFGTTRWTDFGPSELCPGGGTIYYNVFKKGYFFSTTCPSGYTPNGIWYSVPANTYSSTISQYAADQLAIADINANGQNYANSFGTCTATGCVWENCHGLNEASQCINGECEIGFRINDETYYDSQLNQWVCVYHYEYSNGFWTAAFYSYGNSPCYNN